MSDLFRKPLVEKYRPAAWNDVVGQDKIVSRMRLLANRKALPGRAYWLSGQSGTGNTTIARLIAQEVADEFMIEEVDATSLTVPALIALEKASALSGWGDKRGRAFIVNEAHGLRKDVIRQFLVVLERIPAHVVWIFTTTCEGQEPLFENYSDGSPLPRAVWISRSHAAAWRKRSPRGPSKSRSKRDWTAARSRTTCGSSRTIRTISGPSFRQLKPERCSRERTVAHGTGKNAETPAFSGVFKC